MATSTTSSTLPAALCAPAPRPDCVEAAKGTLVVDERVPSRGKLRVVWKALTGFVPTADLGNPLSGDTEYAVCLYDDLSTVAGELHLDRAQATCGPTAKPCWKSMGGLGFRYSDRNATVHGIKRIVLKGGPTGKGKLVLKAKVVPGRSASGLPPGIPLALSDSQQVTAQIVSSDAGCFTLTTNVVTGAESDRFAGRRR